MKAGIGNLVFGLVAVAAGASGQFAIPFTNSPTALMVAGGALALFGAYQIVRSRSR